MTRKNQTSVANSETQQSDITDKAGFAARWKFSRRTVDNLIAKGLPHCKVGERRVRIVVAEADQWMREQFGTSRLRNS